LAVPSGSSRVARGGLEGLSREVAGAEACGGLPAPVQPPFEPGGSAV